MLEVKGKPFPIFFTLICTACIVIMFFLGMWQLDRKSQKEQRIAELTTDILNLNQSQVVDIAKNKSESLQDRQVEFTGVASQHYFLIDNKTHYGKRGYEVIRPVAVGANTVLVNMGWIEAPESRQQLPDLVFAREEVSLSGMISLANKNPFVRETNSNFGQFPAVLQQADFDQIEQHLSTTVLPIIVLLEPTPSTEFVREWQPIVMPPEKHLGYAMQWFGLAIAGLTVLLLTLGKFFSAPNPSGAIKNGK